MTGYEIVKDTRTELVTSHLAPPESIREVAQGSEIFATLNKGYDRREVLECTDNRYDPDELRKWGEQICSIYDLGLEEWRLHLEAYADSVENEVRVALTQLIGQFSSDPSEDEGSPVILLWEYGERKGRERKDVIGPGASEDIELSGEDQTFQPPTNDGKDNYLKGF